MSSTSGMTLPACLMQQCGGMRHAHGIAQQLTTAPNTAPTATSEGQCRESQTRAAGKHTQEHGGDWAVGLGAGRVGVGVWLTTGQQGDRGIHVATGWLNAVPAANAAVLGNIQLHDFNT